MAGLIPSRAGGTFSKSETRYYLVQRPCCCFGCPDGYEPGGSLTVEYTLDGSAVVLTMTLTTGSTEFGLTWYTVDPPFPSPGSMVLLCESGTGGQCCDSLGRPIARLVSIGIPWEPPEDATPMTGFQAFTTCHGGTPFPTTQTLGAPVTEATDLRALLSPGGGAFRCGCSREIDTTFTAAHPSVHGESISVRIHGTVCVPTGDVPPDTRWWQVLYRTYPYVRWVKGNKVYRDETSPRHWLSGYYLGTDDAPPTGVDFVLTDPFWCVAYQDFDEAGRPVGEPYPDCYQTGIAAITCRDWGRKVGCAGEKYVPDRGATPPTVTTGVVLDPRRANPPTAYLRSRTFVDGPWPDRASCCKSCPACGRLSKAAPIIVYDFGDAREVYSDFGKKPGGGPFESENYLRCKLGPDFDAFDVVRYPGTGGPPFNGYSSSKKQAFRSILGAPQESFTGDDEGPDVDPSAYPPVLGEVNEAPKHWGTKANDTPGSLTPLGGSESWSLPTRWWVLPVLVDDSDPASLLQVVEKPRVVIPAVWAAGPFDSEAAATAAATPAGPYWCGKFQDRDADGNAAGPSYRACVRQQDLPYPPDPTPPVEGGTPPPRWRVGVSLTGAALDPDITSPPGAITRDVVLADGPWVGAEGVGDDPKANCRGNCGPCDGGGTMVSARAPRTGRPVAAAPAPVRPPCRWELPVVEYAVCNDPAKHVRACGFEGHEIELCARGASGHPDVQSCRSCPHYTPPMTPGRE